MPPRRDKAYRAVRDPRGIFGITEENRRLARQWRYYLSNLTNSQPFNREMQRYAPGPYQRFVTLDNRLHNLLQATFADAQSQRLATELMWSTLRTWSSWLKTSNSALFEILGHLDEEWDEPWMDLLQEGEDLLGTSTFGAPAPIPHALMQRSQAFYHSHS